MYLTIQYTLVLYYILSFSLYYKNKKVLLASYNWIPLKILIVISQTKVDVLGTLINGGNLLTLLQQNCFGIHSKKDLMKKILLPPRSRIEINAIESRTE